MGLGGLPRDLGDILADNTIIVVFCGFTGMQNADKIYIKKNQ